MTFFTVSSDFTKHSLPSGSITKGLHYAGPCPGCRSEPWMLDEKLEIALDPDKGTRWPDVLECPGSPLLILSCRVIAAWKREGLGPLPVKPITIVGDLPRRVKNQPPPDYFFVDGPRLQGAKLDLEASGYVGIKRCPRCEVVTYDVSATSEKQRSQKYLKVLVAQSWTGLHLFTTDFQPYGFYCTGELVRLAHNYKLTNFRFVTLDANGAADNDSLDYLADDFAL